MSKILITGASRGIGRSIATKLAQKENTLFLHGRDESKLKETEAAIQSSGVKTKIVVADLAVRSEVEKLAESIESEKINILINNAAIAGVNDADKILLEDWDKVLAVNVTAPFILTKSFLKIAQEGDSIVNILSIAARQVFPGWSSYCMSKYALEGFSQTVRAEVRPRGIRVINIYPASTNTDIWEQVPGEFDRQSMMSPDEVGEAVAFALARPKSVLIDDILLGNTGRMG